jgi:dipeptidyl aminopeptidase/acylaminoacyl peptidase
MSPSGSLRPVSVLMFVIAWSGCRGAPFARQSASESKEVRSTSAEAFVRVPAVTRPVLSPDGRRIAGLAARDGVQVVFEMPHLGERGNDKVNFLSKIDPETIVRALGWSGNGVLVVGYEQPRGRAELDREAQLSADGIVVHNMDTTRVREDRREYRMVALRVDTWRPHQVGESWPLSVSPARPDAVIHWLPDEREYVLVNTYEPGAEGASVRRARVRDGWGKDVVPATPGIDIWYADHEGRVRAGSGRSEEGITGVVVARSSEAEPFAELAGAGTAQHTDFEFAGFDRDPQTLYLRALGASGRKELVSYDLARKRLGARLYGNPEFDVGSLVYSPIDGALWAVEYDAERPALHFFDTEAEREQASIDSALPGTTNRVVSYDAAAQTAIVRTSSDVIPPDYYRYDRERKRMDFLFTELPELDRTKLSPMKPIHYTTRDGIEIAGYLTLPRTPEQKNLPAIVIPHDGPSARVRWDWDPVVQFLASRGFAVLQPNYRGSTGYGRDHERLGYGQWGLAMQDDLADAAHWLVEQGIASKGRVGIYGVGYGGYAALLAVARDPELFRAAASYGAITDLVGLLDHPDQYRSSDLNQPTASALPGDRIELAARSPARQVTRIRAPLLVGHGLEDPIVSPDQASAMIEAVKAAGGSVESHLLRRELHEITNQVNRIEFYEALAQFFERHLVPIEAL